MHPLAEWSTRRSRRLSSRCCLWLRDRPASLGADDPPISADEHKRETAMTEDPASDGGEALAALLHETRKFAPPPEFVDQANAQPGIYAQAAADPQAWWAEQAESLTW